MPDTPAPAIVLTGNFTVVNLTDRTRTDYGYMVPAIDSRDPGAPYGGTVLADMSTWSRSVQHTVPNSGHVWAHPADTLPGSFETSEVLCAGLTFDDHELVVVTYDPADTDQADSAHALARESAGWSATPVTELEDAIVVAVEKAATRLAHRIAEPGFRK